MPQHKGRIILMGSGELSPSMVEVHKAVLSLYPHAPLPVFVDTPAGFQLNVDEIAQKAIGYFSRHLQSSLNIASLKSAKDENTREFQNALSVLEQANYILIGPGSPTYAVKQWEKTRVPAILAARISAGASLAAASAAALSAGRFTLPVYEIYKVGQEPHWIEGIDLLGRFGLNLTVVPHWNNAEGGTHDTRFCYMGKSRFTYLRSLLPKDLGILGIDEHTACILDFEQYTCQVRGKGRVTLLLKDKTHHFKKGENFSMDLLQGKPAATASAPDPVQPPWQQPGAPRPTPDGPPKDTINDPILEAVLSQGKNFDQALKIRDALAMASALTEMENLLWETRQGAFDDHITDKARTSLKNAIAALAETLAHGIKLEDTAFIPLVESLVALRARFRKRKQFSEADAVRDCLENANIHLIDGKDGSHWEMDV